MGFTGLRAEDAKLCVLAVIGVDARSQKRFLAIEDGMRESTQSWREVLLMLKARGMNAPKMAIGDGAMGFWSALEEIYPDTRHQRCWLHKTLNVLNAVPQSIQPEVKHSLHEKQSKGYLTRNGMLHMMFKLAECAQNKWRRQRGFDYLAKVITGVKFIDGIEATTIDQNAA